MMKSIRHTREGLRSVVNEQLRGAATSPLLHEREGLEEKKSEGGEG